MRITVRNWCTPRLRCDYFCLHCTKGRRCTPAQKHLLPLCPADRQHITACSASAQTAHTLPQCDWLQMHKYSKCRDCCYQQAAAAPKGRQLHCVMWHHSTSWAMSGVAVSAAACLTVKQVGSHHKMLPEEPLLALTAHHPADSVTQCNYILRSPELSHFSVPCSRILSQ
jgi:hypothetical protein